MKPVTLAALLGGGAAIAILAFWAGGQTATSASEDGDGLVLELVSPWSYGGFGPVAASVSVTGGEAAEDFVRNCPGHVAGTAIPARLGSDIYELHLAAGGDGLAALVIEKPDGLFECVRADEDGYAASRLSEPATGDYRLWPALTAPRETRQIRVSLADSELPRAMLRPFNPDRLGEARLGTVAFDPDGGNGRQQVAAGNLAVRDPLSDLDPACSGHGDISAPDAALTLAEAEDALSLYAESDTDLVIAVLDPAGVWRCNDDTFGLNPAVTISPAPEGEYRIWTGAFSSFGEGRHETFASRGGPVWTDGADAGFNGIDLTGRDDPDVEIELAHDAEPASGRLTLGGEERVSRLSVAFPGGPDSARSLDWACAGWIDAARPDAVLDLAETAPLMTILASSDRDTTLVVRAPDGEVLCNDDFDGLDPGIEIPDAAPGAYAIWVGGYSSGEGMAALSATLDAPDFAALED
ncbi:hypothetical protein FKB34_08110 [Glycocaulis profundi]|nr:hypothetical protein FKB34_08110 [Glycocaulis profundi]